VLAARSWRAARLSVTRPSATSPSSAPVPDGDYYGPGGRFGLVGLTTTVRLPRRARDAATATRLWAEAERLTGVSLAAAEGQAAPA